MNTEIQLPQPIARMVFRCSGQTQTELPSRMPIHEGSMLTAELLQQARETARTYDPSLAVLINPSLRPRTPAIGNGVDIVVWDRRIPPQRIRAEHAIQPIENPMPAYARDEAVVQLAIVIGKDGTVTEVDPLAGLAPLIPLAIDAVRRWKYQPTLLNGRPVEVETTVALPFPAKE